MAEGKQRGGCAKIIALGVLLFAIVAAFTGWRVHRDYLRFADTELSIGANELVLEVRAGDSFERVLSRLRKLGVQDGHDLYWKGLAWETDVVRRLRVGEYALRHGLTPRRLLDKLERGIVIQHSFTIVEGWNFRELRLALAKEPTLEQTITGLPDDEVMAALGVPDQVPEGRFLPETYHFTRGSRDIDVLRRAHTALEKTLEHAWDGRTADLPLKTPYEALTLASIIEKETGKASERPRIAGVFVRRLKLGMKLQTDPTVIYGLGEAFNGNLTRAHLQTDTLHNTYTRFGLPPTPIAMPGRDAIEAALHPAAGNELYFVARGDGSHVFSATLTEHNRAVARYQLRRRSAAGGTP